MKLRNILLTVILVMAVAASSVFTAFADEAAGDSDSAGLGENLSGLVDSLFGEEGALSGYVEEGKDMLEGLTSEDGDSNILGGLTDALSGLTDDENGGSLDDILSMFQGDEEGGFDLGNLSQILTQYLGDEDSSLDGFDFGDIDFEALINASQNIKAAEEAAIIDINTDRLVPGEIQIVANSIIWQDEQFTGAEDETCELCMMVQLNYNRNDENQLEFVNGNESLTLFTLQKNEDGDYEVTEAEIAEEGDDYMESVEALCDKVGITVEDCENELIFTEFVVLLELTGYLEDNPDIVALEYDGVMMTLDELNAYEDEVVAAITEMLAEEEDADVEDAE